MKKASLFRARIEALTETRMLAAVALAYAALLIGASLARYWPLIGSSLSLGEYATALTAAGRALYDLWPTEQPLLWLVGALLVAMNIVLAGAYFARAKSVFSLATGGSFNIAAVAVFIFGLGCLSCGTALAAFLATIAGASLMPQLFVWGGEAAVLLGLGGLFAATVVLAKKVTDPLVC